MVKLVKKIVSIITVVLVTSSIGLTSLPSYEVKADTTIPINESGAESNNILSSITSEEVKTDETTDYSLTTNVKDGVILHAWCWSFNTIKANLKDIAEAGYSTIQTSPANRCNDSQSGMQIKGEYGAWYWQYQPTDFTIGNYQIGSKEDFKSLCEEAHKYGIKIIVDVLPNHTSGDGYQVSQELINSAGGWDNLYHGNGFNGIKDHGDRAQCTTGQLKGLFDINTENPAFQAYYLKFANDLIDCGADGLRYDAAKHIGLPSDPLDSKTKENGWKNNFWSVATGKEAANGVTLKNADKLFIYGEVIQGSKNIINEYATYMGLCADVYGGVIRTAVYSKNVSVANISSYKYAVDPSKLVTWVESHDNYCTFEDSVG